ncbi:MFS transporter [Granulicella sp. L60]|uniref:MFS transporter n=1 Tax=Granulicella sp. L60 TaxID=1641866 RepID=UPI0020B1616D|nr:MFS transporter [Granulicella sp. L60]
MDGLQTTTRIFFINVPIGLLALFLTRLIQDPPAFTAERAALRKNGKISIDGTGIALIILASAALEITLDRGQIDDWLGSNFICWTLGLAVLGWIGTILWELYVDEPIIDFRLLKNRNFAIAAVLFFIFGIGFFGTTTLVPQLLQALYGYRAIDAGFVLGPGALVITVLAPISALLLQKRIVSPKIMMTFRLSVVGASLWHFSTMNLDTNGGHYLMGRVFQGIGYGFFFVPVNMIAYSMLRPEQNNKASSLTNLFRNWGGSFGIAFITTSAERRQDLHQVNVGSGLGSSSQSLQQHIHALTDYR